MGVFLFFDGKLLKRSDGLEFIYDTQGLAGVVDSSGSTAKTYFYRKDAQGNTVACLNENGEEVRKPIETVAVGTMVLAYDEETGEKAYKPVVQLFKNETKRWCTVTVEVDGQKEQIVSTPGHQYYLPNNTENREIGLKQEHESYITLSEKWVSACKLKAGDKVLLSDGKYGIIVSVKIEELETPETTYNFEVED